MPTISIGVTGGIGSGKSYVCHMLEEMGIPVLYTDDEARRLMTSDQSLVEALGELIGMPILHHDGTLRKSVISAFIRGDEQNAEKVNGLVHPAARKSMHEWVSAQNVPVVAVECALLFETQFDKDVDYTMAVSAPLDVRVERVMLRDGKNCAEVLQWNRMQMADSEKERRADFVVVNDGTAPLREQLTAVLDGIGRKR